MTRNRNAGQTLIETVVAVFIMVMGITAALGLATYSLNAATDITEQAVGIGLAREGLEAVKNMRDTNWLVDALAANCANSDGSLTTCYKNWLNPSGGYNINSQNANRLDFNIDFDASTAQFWQANNLPAGSSQPATYRLNYFSSGGNKGFYSYSSGSGAVVSPYYRQVIIDDLTITAPFDSADLGPRVLVTSQVWWLNKKCPAISAWPPPPACPSVKLQMYLTNWKNY